MAPNLKLLRYFVAVAEELHFGRAARKLGMSQPPLTQHIQALEAELGLKLFDRNRRSVALTAAGQLLLDQARDLLGHAERVMEVMTGARLGQIGHLSIGCVPSALYGVLPQIIRRFRERHSGVRLMLEEAHTADILNRVADGRFSVGLAWENQPPAPLKAQVVQREVFVAAVPETHPLAACERLSLAEIGAETLIISPRRVTPHHHDTLIAAFNRLGIVPTIGYEPPSVLSQIGFVANGFGVSIVPSYVRGIPAQGVVFRPITEGLEPVELCLIWNDRFVAEPINLFRATIRELWAAAAKPERAPARPSLAAP